MIHDLSCPQGFFALWYKARAVFGSYLRPVDEACGGLFPPMVQKILVINVPRLFSPVWAVISRLIPEQHEERIVMLTSSQTTPDGLEPYLPKPLQPPHIRTDALAGGWPEPDANAAREPGVNGGANWGAPDIAPASAGAPHAGKDSSAAAAPPPEAAGWFSYFASYAADSPVTAPVAAANAPAPVPAPGRP